MSYFKQIIDFYESFEAPAALPRKVEVHNPYSDRERRAAIHSFYSKYFDDNQPRTHILGINPSKLNSSSTGVHYTDGFALSNFCGINNTFSQSRELTSEFFYNVVARLGGADEFFSTNFPWAMMPVSVTDGGLYKNYYEDDLSTQLEPILVRNVHWIASLPSNGRLIILGIGENKKYFERLDGTPFGYTDVRFLPHPRWVLQYNRANIEKYLDQYLDALG
ncbi:DUF4918 family protein [Qipengyuania sediminis]|uniref:DUF4918 family protein n=1 Tax=Qipengyuania sediminis TaxID=1532023 RepID=UPI0014045528|nr:DUF4918 family protein [Qipengyuania sediminis]